MDLLYRLTGLGIDLVHPAAFTGKWISWQTDPTWEGMGYNHRSGAVWVVPCADPGGRARLRSRPYGIQTLPLYLESLDPPLQNFLIPAVLEPFVDDLLQFFIRIEESHGLFV